MDEFTAGTDVTLSIAHANASDGSPLTVTDLQFQVLSATGALLSDYATPAGFNPTDAATSVTIVAANNASTDKIDVRQVNVKLVTAGGTYKQTFFYKLIGDITNLTPMVDSFMTYPESIIYRMKMSENMSYFDMLTDELKAVALMNSFEAIMKLKFNFNTDNWCSQPTDISAYNLAQFQALPAAFQDAVKKAQLSEANMLVENSPIREKIRQGIISETIGESSMFFARTTQASVTKFPGLSDEAYGYIKKWLFKSATSSQSLRIGRA